MKKSDILSGNFSKETVDSLSVDEKSKLIYSFHCKKRSAYDRYLFKNIGEVRIKNMIEFLKLCLETNQDNVEWFLLHIVDSLSQENFKKTRLFIVAFRDTPTFKVFNLYRDNKREEMNKQIKSVWVSGRNHLPFEVEKKRIENEKIENE